MTMSLFLSSMFLQQHLLLSDSTKRRMAATKKNAAMTVPRMVITDETTPRNSLTIGPEHMAESRRRKLQWAKSRMPHPQTAVTGGATTQDNLAISSRHNSESCLRKFKRLVKSTTAHLLPKSSYTAPVEIILTVNFQHVLGKGLSCLDVLAESEGTITLSERTTLQEFENELQRQARKMVFHNDAVPSRISGELVFFGENCIIMPRDWEELKVLLLTRRGFLTFRFQVLRSNEEQRSILMESFEDLGTRAESPRRMC